MAKITIESGKEKDPEQKALEMLVQDFSRRMIARVLTHRDKKFKGWDTLPVGNYFLAGVRAEVNSKRCDSIDAAILLMFQFNCRCPKCNGTYEVPCPECHGAGEYSAGSHSDHCPECYPNDCKLGHVPCECVS